MYENIIDIFNKYINKAKIIADFLVKCGFPFILLHKKTP